MELRFSSDLAGRPIPSELLGCRVQPRIGGARAAGVLKSKAAAVRRAVYWSALVTVGE